MADTSEVIAAEQSTAETTEKKSNAAGDAAEKVELDSEQKEKIEESENGKSTEAIERSEDNSESSKSPVKAEVSRLDKDIIRQVEYYFGDANLDRDKFLNEEIKKDDGWVQLTTLLTFNRLKSLSEDATVIMSALRKSTNDLLELKADNSAIRRDPAKPVSSSNDRKAEIENRLLYVKGFPTELTLDDLIEHFDPHGSESITLRTDIKRKFKGSVFVLFKTEQQAKAYLEQPEMKYKDTPLIERLYKKEYYQKKMAQKMGGKQEEVKRKEELKKKKEQEEKEELLSRMKRAAILKVSGIEAGTAVDKIKEFFGDFGKVMWVDFEKGSAEALIRFGEDNQANEAWEKAVGAATDGKVTLNDKVLSAVVMEGEEEKTHWKKVFESMQSKFNRVGNRNRVGRGGQRGGARGGHRGGHKRRNNGADGNETSEKRGRTDD